MGKNERNRNIREDILAAASALMLQKGVKETSLKDIASEVGISKGTLYYHFSSKDDMIFEIADKHLTQLTDELENWISDIDNDSSTEHILKIVIERISNLETRGKFHIYLISEAILNNNILRERFKQKYEEWLKLMETSLQAVLKDQNTDCRVLSFLMVAVLDGFSMQKLVGVEEIPVEDTARIIASLG